MRRWILMALFVCVTALACGDDDDDFRGGFVGAPCGGNGDCPSRCEEGFCTIECEHDGHCPAGTACIDEHGGVCAVLCRSGVDCASGFACRSTDRRGASGDASVCRG